MSVAISVKEVSKRYRIGLVESEQKTFAGQLIDMIKAPLTNLQNLRSLSRFEKEDDSTFWALRDISFEVQEGEVLGIIGHNGAGKSALLKILSRITEPTSGEITIRGRVSSLLEVGTGFHPDLTGRENIYMNGTILGMRKKEIDRKLEEIIEFSGVGKYIDTPVKRYSSGMKVRLAFSVAAHLEPEVLIIDEVLAVGDAEFQKKCLGKMNDVAKAGRTVLFVSHQMNAIASLCTRSILLSNGEKKFDGDISKCIASYYSSSSLTNLRSGRITTSGFSFENVSFIQDDITLTNNAVKSQKKLILRIDFKNEKTKLSEIKIAVTVKDSLGNKIFVLDNVFNNQVFSDKNTNFVFCEIEKLQLIPGFYVLDLWASDNSEILDTVESSVEMEVLSLNYYGHSKMKKIEKHGYLFIDHSWYN